MDKVIARSQHLGDTDYSIGVIGKSGSNWFSESVQGSIEII